MVDIGSPGDPDWGITLGSNEPYSSRSAIFSRRCLMDAYGTARLAAKEAESAIVARICEDFNLTPVLARIRASRRPAQPAATAG